MRLLDHLAARVPLEDVAPSGFALGVAARLSRYLQVLTQARKMGKETISSQELADYTHVNSTQIRRDLAGFGKHLSASCSWRASSVRCSRPVTGSQQAT